MFGYINANRKKLSETDRSIYQKFHCGLLRELYRISGLKGQILFKNDLCFLAILLQSLYEPKMEQEDFKSPLHPFTFKQRYSSAAIRYAADMNIILAYHSLLDHYKDNNSKISGLYARLLKKDYLRIKAKYPRQANAVEDYIVKISIAEQTKETNIDIVSSYTGEMLGELFNWKDDAWSKTLYCMGYYMGKFIYIIDAYDDLYKDEKTGCYNALIFMRNETPREFDTFVKVNLTSVMSECTRSFERLPIVDNENILRNIIYSGIWTKYETIQLRGKKTLMTPKQIY